jgi:hypothetical protein
LSVFIKSWETTAQNKHCNGENNVVIDENTLNSLASMRQYILMMQAAMGKFTGCFSMRSIIKNYLKLQVKLQFCVNGGKVNSSANGCYKEL